MVLKTKEEAKANFEASIAYIPNRYVAGVQKADWLGPARSDNAEKNYAAGVQQAVSTKRRQLMISKLSNEEWKSAAIEKGAPIIGQRIAGALNKWLSNWGPMYDQVASKVSALPPKTTDWRANINNRLVPTVETWRKAAGKT
ncbi:MAG: hypothetical protein K6T73_08155 [Candidatus Bathyarchaeota archaeon]|nr:hypothetical protein [Candidatus Bathyarchaeota archaeon]